MVRVESLTTERLVLRPWKSGDSRDATALFQYAGDPLVGLMAGWPAHSSVAESVQVITNILGVDESYAITLRDSDDPIGSIALKPVSSHVIDSLSRHSSLSEWNSSTSDTAREVGYWVGRPFWGNGIATEALHALVSHSFLDLHTDCIWGVHYSDNKSSEAVLEKCGFHPVCQYEEAYYPLIDEYHNTIIRAITLREWSMRNRTTRQ